MRKFKLQIQGFAGVTLLVRWNVANWRAGPARRSLSASCGAAAGALSAPRSSPTQVRSPRQARWLHSRSAERSRLRNGSIELPCWRGMKTSTLLTPLPRNLGNFCARATARSLGPGLGGRWRARFRSSVSSRWSYNRAWPLLKQR